jgi:ectoine hydroxylase-related dioxygenase (phytanoyl-CoA dioxygenase family)
MDMVTALAELGVTAATLDAGIRERLDRDGYVALAAVLSDEQVQVVRARLADLVNKGPMFQPCFTASRVLACMAHVLGDFKLSSLNSRAVRPGQGHQVLHTDWGGPVPAASYQVCNSIWLLDDFTAVNGATRVVPGSHRSGTAPRLALPDPAAAHPDEVLITGPAGTVVIFNSHLWHGGTQNRSDRPRRALHSYFTCRGNRQQLDQQKYIRPQTRARLSPAARFILDV